MSHYYEKNAYTVEQIAKMQSTNSPTIVVEDFISQDELVELMIKNGFKKCSYRNLSGGIVSIHSGWKI